MPIFVVALRTGAISARCSALEKMQKAASPTQMGPLFQQGQVLTPTSMKIEPLSSLYAINAPNGSAKQEHILLTTEQEDPSIDSHRTRGPVGASRANLSDPAHTRVGKEMPKGGTFFRSL